MPQFDLGLEDLHTYRPEPEEPADFDDFWRDTLESARGHRWPTRFEPMNDGLVTVQAFDVRFAGFGGQPIAGWLIVPRARTGPLPTIIEYIGYGGGRGLPEQWQPWASWGYAHFVMDSRGQGSVWRLGDTADPEPDGGNPQYPGFMTRGILDPRTYYYRRLFTDGVLACQAVREHEAVDASRLVVTGTSQGGPIAMAVAALEPSFGRPSSTFRFSDTSEGPSR